ncbi:MAG TPA: PPE domain-containing protein, partial [Actinophytocola sp.]|uniref:PPE domain-containing protein n=1 Tax=Actinophytocola sp. TaxID=1872138 RepID=UPI002DDD6B02
MDGDYGLSDLRFAGYSNEELATQVDGLRNGQGSESLHNAARALVSLAAGLAETDRVLREQLREIGVSWEGQAAEGGAQATQDAAVYADEAVGPVGDSAAGVSTQSGSFSHTRNSAPDSGTLRGPTELSGFDRFAGAFGHTTDHARAVRDTSAAREQAVAGMDGYQRSSVDSLGRARTLPVPPGMDLVTQPADTGTQVGGVGAPGVGGAT